MSRAATALSLVLISFCSFAQTQGYLLERSLLKKLSVSYVPAKKFTSLLHTGNDSASTYKPRMASVPGFYINQTEVTNKEYRDFVHYVRDSVAHVLLQHMQNDNTIDWSRNIDWNDSRLDAMMTPPDERIFGRKEIDPAKLVFTIDFFGQNEDIRVYPDTLVWIKDFNYSYNEPLVKKYFAHPAYNKYPVVGVSLKQAMAFCAWKTKQLNIDAIVRLPTNAEWESAAIGANDTTVLVTAGKKYNCNFGVITERTGIPSKGYKDDGFFYTGPVKSYASQNHGLYDMQGNVSEWTSTSIDEIMNVEVKTEKQKGLFIVKGGGWNSTPYYLQPGVCQFYHADAANSWTGFRYVIVGNKPD